MYNIIYNPKAARGKSEYYLNELLKVFTVNNIPYTLYETEYQGHATQIAQMIEKKGFDKIIIVGGDGTIFEVLNGCQNLNNMNFGVIPAGTGNDTARMLKTNKNPINSKIILLESSYQPHTLFVNLE